MADRFVRNCPTKAMAQGFIEGVRFINPEVAGNLFIVEDHDPPVPPWSYAKQRESPGIPYQPQQRWTVMRKDAPVLPAD